ncbi:coproporphyrinogen III oxidase [Pseudomonas alkylphenolica]|uniref:Oxygen-independent coproporphyrinogen III oxidase n=1 Tax=Pseudomonas alkylphenolica TaxID=237609 RepID=A0A443ZK70_9PSED|nr:coproporphyrinogen III oxidase [Pseudomonas alkylphenolica]RWU19281.1 coproporphyrinogen III oxidase [Pseudomonas alkylphenolica]
MLEDPQSHNEQIVEHDRVVLDSHGFIDTRRFHGGIGSLDVLRALRSSRQQQRPLSLNLQLPPGVCMAGKAIDAYIDCLAREIDLVGCHLGRQQRVEQLHLGGATPGPELLVRLLAPLRKRFSVSSLEGGDYSADVDVNHTGWATIGLLREQGFNHVSLFGSDQSQDPVPFHSLIDAARTFGYRTVSIELRYGHAWQTPVLFLQQLAGLVELEPDRLLVLDCAQAPQRHAQWRMRPSGAEQDKVLMRHLCLQHLLAAGYQHIGLGQFVRPDDDLAVARERGYLGRNGLGFTPYGYCDHVGLGLGAISQFETLYAQNTHALNDYLTQLQRGQLATCRGWRPGSTS